MRFDYCYVNCDETREAISALLDGEAPGVGVLQVEDHLDRCEACRRWQERAHLLTRSVRLQPAPPAAHPPAELMGVLRGKAPLGYWRGRELAVTRLALVAVAAAQLALSIPMLLLGHGRSAPLHIAHEMGSFDVAMGIGFLVAALLPARAVGMRSLVGVAAALLVLTAALDLADGQTSLLDEAPHLLVVAGWLLLRRLALKAPPGFDLSNSVLATLGSAKAALARRVRGRRAGPSSEPIERASRIAMMRPPGR